VFIINSKLLACVDPVLGIARDFAPQRGGTLVVAAALGHLREITAGAGAEFRGQTKVDRLSASGMRAVGFATAMEKTREAKEVEAVNVIAPAIVLPEK